MVWILVNLIKRITFCLVLSVVVDHLILILVCLIFFVYLLQILIQKFLSHLNFMKILFKFFIFMLITFTFLIFILFLVLIFINFLRIMIKQLVFIISKQLIFIKLIFLTFITLFLKFIIIVATFSCVQMTHVFVIILSYLFTCLFLIFSLYQIHS